MSTAARFGLAATPCPRQKQSIRDSFSQSENGADPAFALGQVRGPKSDVFDGGWSFDSSQESVSAVLNDGQSAFDAAVALQEAVWPLRLRFSMVSAPPGGAAGQDDAIRDKALRVLGKADKRERFHFELSGKAEAELTLGAAMGRLHLTLMDEWTDARCTAVRSYRRLGKQSEVAKELGVSQQAVSQMLLGARFRDLQAAEGAMREWLSGPKRTSLWPLRNVGTTPSGV
ncbi:MAG: hypothetical protein CMJ94_00270 [Planctomycetes bacterium]|nr:hypothetical protein [Planctomycetota bacterium]